jgi:hypothetical protein
MPNQPRLPEMELRRRARQEIEKGRLPESPAASIWGGRGSGQPCTLCGDPIRADQVEYEIADSRDGDTLRFHLPCHTAWQFESSAIPDQRIADA